MPRGSDGKWGNITDEEARATDKGPVVRGFSMEYEWHTGPWQDILDCQIQLIKQDIRRARAGGKLIVYLSCPITARGGGFSGANVDIAKFTERSLLQHWGEAFWILNPAQYQLESKAGTGLMESHAKELGIDLADLRVQSNPAGGPHIPGGGDYMRMWTKVLVENAEPWGGEAEDPDFTNSGRHFDAFYFLGPRDVHAFFTQTGVSLTAGIASYFARCDAMDSDFRDYFAVDGITWGKSGSAQQTTLRDKWESMRFQFLRFYGLRASVNFSLGSHDEWNILREINIVRRKNTEANGKLDGDVGLQLAAYFDGGQVDPASTEIGVSRGYALSKPP
jgi:hypothetical protein